MSWTVHSVHSVHFVHFLLLPLLLLGCGAAEKPTFSESPAPAARPAPSYTAFYGESRGAPSPNADEVALLAKLTDGGGDLGCARDPGLTRAARRHAEALAEIDRGPSPADIDHLRFAVLAEGGTEYVLRPFAVRGWEGKEKAFSEFVKSQRGLITHCGLGAARRGGRTAAVFLGADRQLEISPVPVENEIGRTLEIRGRPARGDSTAVQAYLGLPDGSARRLEIGRSAGGFSVSIPFERAGRYELELSVDSGNGPETAALLPLFAGIEKDERPVVGPDSADSRGADVDLGDEIVALVNTARERLGIRPFSRDARLDGVALAHCRDMVALGYFGHRAPNGRLLADRLMAVGLRPTRCGENVARSSSAVRAQRNLMASPSHRLELLDPGYTHIGVGTARDGAETVLTEVFVRWN